MFVERLFQGRGGFLGGTALQGWGEGRGGEGMMGGYRTSCTDFLATIIKIATCITVNFHVICSRGRSFQTSLLYFMQ